MRRSQASQILDRVEGKILLVVGDLMLDEYLWGATDRISPEAPVPVVQWGKRTFAPGWAANVVHNVVALGAKAVVCGVVGDDNTAVELRRALTDVGADLSGLVEVPGRLTTRKTRVFARSQQLLRVDRETAEPVAAEVADALAATCRSRLDSVDGILFSDYAKGALTNCWVRETINAAKARKLLVTAGPKPESVGIYAGATLLSFNRSEAAQAAGTPICDLDSLIETGKRLVAELNVEALVVTRGGEGASLFGRRGSVEHIAPRPVQVFDECGAGDTFLTAATLALAGGTDFKEAIALGNVAAAAVVQKVGVCPATREDLLELCPTE